MNKKEHRMSKLRPSQLTAYVSVALLLLILGIMALTGITAHRVTQGIRSNIGFVAMVDEAAFPEESKVFAAKLRKAPWAARVSYTDSATVLERWKRFIGDDEAGVLDVNPFLPEYEVKVRPEWASADSIAAIVERVRGIDCVYDAKAQTDMVGSVNHTVNTIFLILLMLAAALTLIAIVLVHNMVRMDIYANRHIIHTMKYVGATNAFIRRPYLRAALIGGASAGGAAAIMLAALTAYAGSVNPAISDILPWTTLLWTGLVIVGAGAVLCSSFALLATGKYLRKSYDEMFR